MTNRPAAKTYADAGVDLAAAAAVKDRIKAIAAATLGSAVIAGPGGFGGVIDPDPSGDTLLVASTDGVGTKLRIADALGRHDTVGASIVNHCINDILPAGARPQGGQLRVGHGPGERQRAAGDPDRDHRPGMRHQLRDERRHEEDAAADDVGDDDGGAVERTEPPIERRERRCGTGRSGWKYGGHAGGYRMSSWRSTETESSRTNWFPRCLTNRSISTSTKSRCTNISDHTCSPV